MRVTTGDLIHAEAVMKNFQKPKTDEEVFYNLMLVLMVPQSTFKNCMVALNELKKSHFFLNYVDTPEDLYEIIKPCRFYKHKAKYLVAAKKNFSEIVWRLRIHDPKLRASDERSHFRLTNLFVRDWLVKNVKGLGMKTASHLLRNMGATNLAIVDTHILKYLKINQTRENGEMVEKVKWDYMDLERRLERRAKRYGCSIAVLDIVVWHHYSKTEWSDYTY